MTSDAEWTYQVEVTNWPEPSGQAVTIALAAASLIVAVVALITSIASLRWMKESWRREGPELEVEFSFAKLDEHIQKYLGDPSFRVCARNSGRAMTEINWIYIWALKEGQRELVALQSGDRAFGEDRRFLGGQQCTIEIGFADLLPTIGLENLTIANQVILEVYHTFGSETRVLPSRLLASLRSYMKETNADTGDST